MNDISMPIHLLIPTILSVIFLIAVIYNRKRIILKTSKNLFATIVVFISVYLLIVGSALTTDLYYKLDLSKYDLNNNGFFESTNNEINENQKAALQKVSNDTGRNFSFVTGLILSFIISIVLYIVLFVKNKIKGNPKTQME
jgi:hypothetical protein